MIPRQTPAGEADVAAPLKNAFAAICDAVGVYPALFLRLRSTVDGFDDREYGEARRLQRRAHLLQQQLRQSAPAVGENGLRDDKVEPAAEHVAAKVVVVGEGRALQTCRRPAELAREAVFDQPPVRIDAEISVGLEIGNQQTSETERPATEVQHGMTIAQAQSEQQGELTGAEEVVTVRRTYVRAIVGSAGRERTSLARPPV